MKIFAYGSNMNIERLKKRTPSVTKVANAYISGYKFKCNKVSNSDSSKGNIEETNNSEDVVWGVVFEIPESEKSSLDEAEGLGSGYNENKITVTDVDNNSHDVQVYIADVNTTNDNLQPFDWYKDFIISGAESNDLPKNYIERLNEMNAKVDPDSDRRKRNYGIMGKKID